MSLKVLITGVAGFVGSHMARRLLDEQCEVVGVDNLSQGFESNLKELRDRDGFRFYCIDVQNKEDLFRISQDVTHIVHLAAFKIPRYGGALDTLQVNTRGTENCLEIARHKEGVKVLFSSTSDIYGCNTELPFHEESTSVIGSPQIKRWSYAVSKMFDEQLCFAYHEAYNIPITIVRYFGGYGPHQNRCWKGGPQAAFMKAILEEKIIEIHGDGLQTRSFTFIDDIIQGTYLALVHKNAMNEIFNIGDCREVSILDLAQKVWETAGKKGKVPVKMVPYESFGRYQDVRHRVPDISKAQKLLGFRARTSLEDGLKKTFAWQRSL